MTLPLALTRRIWIFAVFFAERTFTISTRPRLGQHELNETTDVLAALALFGRAAEACLIVVIAPDVPVVPVVPVPAVPVVVVVVVVVVPPPPRRRTGPSTLAA